MTLPVHATACQEAQDPVAQGGTDAQIMLLHDRSGWNNSVKSGDAVNEQPSHVPVFLVDVRKSSVQCKCYCMFYM